MGAQPLITQSTRVLTTPEVDGARSRRTGSVLWPALTALVVCLVWTAAESTRLGVPAPFEDAAMLFKYAENLAHGWGIAWNAGQAPGLTDGATDLGFVLALAPLTFLGLSTTAAAVLLNLAAVLGIGALFGVVNNRLWHGPTWVPVALAALVASGPVNRYVLSGFSPPVMAVLLLGAFALAALAPLARTRRHTLLLLAAAGVAAGACGWWRPEAFALGPLTVLFGLLLTRPVGRQRVISPSTVAALVTPFVVLVAVWAGFRISYFDQLLPTSAVMKSGSVHIANTAFSLQFYSALLLPLVGLLVVRMLGVSRQRSWWIATIVLIASALWVSAALPQDIWDKIGAPVIPGVAAVVSAIVLVPLLVALAVTGFRRRDQSWVFPVAMLTFALLWMGIATTLDWWGRMQWPLVPVLAAIAVTHLVTGGAAAPIGRRTPTAVLVLLTCVGVAPFHLPVGGYFESPFQTAVSEALAPLDTSGVRVATTEAGLIPLAVTGPALDTYGHNNRSIAATHGATLTDELTAFRPNVIAMHGLPPESVRLERCTPEALAAQTKFPAVWSKMVTDIYRYADARNLTLARISETTPCETWSLWVSDDVPAPVRQAIAELPMPGTDVSQSATK